MRTTLMYDRTPIYCGRMNLGQALNSLAEKGWVVDQTLVGARRVGLFAGLATRHKFHIILKKEYQLGENPFRTLSSMKSAAYKEDVVKNTGYNKSVMKNSLKELRASIKRRYDELRSNPESITDNLTRFNSMLIQYKDTYWQIYGKTPDDADYMVKELTKLRDEYENNRSLKELELSIKRKYEELKKEPSAILDNIEEFESMVKEYRAKYVQVYGVAPYNIDDLPQKLMEFSAKKSK